MSIPPDIKKDNEQYLPSVILYSRGRDFTNLDTVKKNVKDFSSDTIIFVRMEDDPNDCFKTDSKNGQRIARVIKRVIDLDGLYE